MRVAGLAVDAADPKRPVGRLVIADGGGGSISIESSIELTSDATSTPVQLHDAAEALHSQLKGSAPQRVIVRRADRPARPRQTDGPKFRLLMEGALTSAACGVVPDTLIGTGKETGEWFGSSKADLDDEAKQVAEAASVAAKYREALSAALAALALGP
jgi:hypothetical protein